MTSKINIHNEADVMVITVNNPPINAGSTEVRKGLLAAIQLFQNDPKSSAVVIIGGGSTFIAGSDIKEFSEALAEPHLPSIIAAIENCPKPVVCALHGAALGGGFELALGCDGRIALEGTMMGLPEVTLGIIPGAGGTQRLPRLIGLEKSIELICGGTRISGSEALKLGILNKLVNHDLQTQAIIFARSLLGQKARIRDLDPPHAEVASVLMASQKALKAGKNRPNIYKAIEMISNVMTKPIDEGLAIEREAFQNLRLSTEAKALRHQFFAERKLFKALSSGDTAPKVIEKIAIIGAGTMGSGIAIACLTAGYTVLLIDQNEVALKNGTQKVKDFYESRVQSGKMAIDKAALILKSFTYSMQWRDIAAADLIVEAVFEDIEVKYAVFQKIEAHANPSALLASNTSYLDIDAIAAKISNPARIFGLHFFSPAQVMKLIEIIRCKFSSPITIASGLQFAKRLGKMPVISTNSFGFIGNRIYAAYRRQCEFMLEEGAYPKQIDQALEDYGFAMGPFAVADLSGLDIAWAMRQSLAATRNPEHRYVSIPDTLCLVGRLGRKAGAGYYQYRAGEKLGTVDPVVNSIIDAASAAKGITRREFTPQEIVKRVLLAMMNEIAHLASEKIVGDVTDCDIALVNGYGFPRWCGGPVFIANEMGSEKLNFELQELANLSGPGFVIANTGALFKPF
ncbi:MAG: 3-hydroxyacyl-CoA dehydrogenase NAD-binding domain-containing protein [Burkholderiaceae bacterium]